MEPLFIDDLQDVQKKTFTKWINAHLSKTTCPPVKDLFNDLRDGHKLLTLLEVLTNEKYKREKGRMRVHHINNINTALQVLQQNGVKLVNISSDDIESGSPKLTLGLIWQIAISFDGQKLVNSQAVSGIEKSLLHWARKFTEQHGLKITDFSTSWSDGRAFLYILHEYVPKFDLAAALKQHPMARLRLSFDLANRHLKIDQLLDPEDVNTNKPDKKSILMYVICLYHAIESLTSSKENLTNLVQQYESLEEIQLLDEKEMVELSKNDENFNQPDGGGSSKGFTLTTKEISSHPKHVGNLTELDDISLGKSVEDLSKFSHVNSNLPLIKTIVTDSLTTSNPKRDDDEEKPMETSPDEDKTQITVKTEHYQQYFYESRSRPTSTATNMSIEIGGYQMAVEEVLTLLLEAEEGLSRELPPVTELVDAKKQFQEHEDFMLKLSEHQQFVGAALEEGARLIAESQNVSNGLTQEEQNEIKYQMFLLNERWETLRVRALDIQSKVHSKLADVQLSKIEELREFLTNTEDRISRMSNVGPGPKELKKQLDENRVLQNDLEQQQKLVDSLSNLVVIVDDDSDSFSDLEDKLAALGERWSHVVKWTATRWEKLQEMSLKWTKLSEHFRIITKWIDVRENDLKSMEGKEVTEIGGIMKRMKEIRFCEKDLDALSKHLQELEAIANSLEMTPEAPSNILENLENLNDRIDAFRQILEVQQIRIESMGFQFPSNSNESVEKPQSWEDFQTKFDGAILLGTLDDVHQEVEMSPQSNKKRKIQKSDKIIDLENKIIDMLSFIDRFNDHVKDLNRWDLKKQLSILEKLDSDLKKRVEEYPNVKDLLEECKAETEVILTLEEKQLSDIGSKYDEFIFKLEELSGLLKAQVDKDKFYKSLTGFKLVLADSRDWFKQHANTASKAELETRLSDMDSLTPEITEAKTLCPADQSDDFKEWKNDFEQFYDSWGDMKRAIMRLIQEKGGFDDLNDKKTVLFDFIKSINRLLVVTSSMKIMEENLKKLDENRGKYEALDELYQYVHENSPPDVIDDDLADAWEKIPTIINDKIIKQNTAIENAHHFETEYESILKQMGNVEDTLKEDVFIVGEIETLQKKAAEYEKHAMDIKKMEIDIISIKNFSEIIIKSSEKDHSELLSNRVQSLSDKYANLIDLFQLNSRKLNQATTQTEDILSRVHQTELWLNDLEMNTPKNENSEIANSNELFQIKSRFQTLKEACEQETIKFRELNESGSDLLLQLDDLVQQRTESRVSYLAKTFTKLNARWNEVTSLVYTRTALLEHISSQLGDFTTLIVQENGYLDKLEKLLRKSPENAADAEEISEELDDLENSIRNHSDERLEKIQEIGKELVDLQFMAETIRNDVQVVVDRWNHLQHQAEQRERMLEQAVSEAQTSESRVSNLQLWIFKVDEILTEHIENDITMEDLPHDFQRLIEEFKNNEMALEEMRTQVTTYQENGKLEAAKRLQEQVDLLEDKFQKCQQKLERFTSPQSGFESRLNRAMGELRNVERSSIVLDVSSASPGNVEDQLQHCLKMYRILSEVKSEIENVIKSGRKICEDKNTRNPKKLGQRIDALKHLYNSLGENVTESKKQLEGLLKLTKELNENFRFIEQYLVIKEETQNIDVPSEEDIENALERCNQIFEEYKDTCEPIYLDDIKERIDDLNSRFFKLKNGSDEMKILNEMKMTLQNIDNISLESLRTMENDLNKMNIKNPSVEKLHSQVVNIVQEAIVSRQQTTQLQSSTVDEDAETEIVVVSDTVRQRRARTPSSNVDSGEIKDSTASQQIPLQNVLPDLLPKTFHLAEASSLFSHISDHGSDSKLYSKSDVGEMNDQEDSLRNKVDDFSVVEIREMSTTPKMSVRNVNLQENESPSVDAPRVGQIVLESVDHFEPEFVETVNIVDASEDTSDTDTCSTPKLDDRHQSSLDRLDELEKELEAYNNFQETEVALRNDDKMIRIERIRISFEERPDHLEKERDILKDSEEVKPKRHIKKLTPDLKDILLSYPERDSFYNSDKENFDEPLIFSDDEDIPRFSLEMANVDSDSDTSRIETPKISKPNTKQSKFTSHPLDEETDASLESRVNKFDKTAKYMIKKLEMTRKKIEDFGDADDNFSAIEHLKLSIAPDAATLISQGDTLVLETHGKPGDLSQRVMATQGLLREKFREVQHAKLSKNSISTVDASPYNKSQNIQPENQYFPSKEKSVSNKKLPTEITETARQRQLNQDLTEIEEIVNKVLQRTRDLIDKPLNDSSAADLSKRILDIKERQEDLKLAIEIASQATPSPKAKTTMESLQKAKSDLSTHCDAVVVTLASLNRNRSGNEPTASAASAATAAAVTKEFLQREGGKIKTVDDDDDANDISFKPSTSPSKESTPKRSTVESNLNGGASKRESEPYVPGSFTAKAKAKFFTPSSSLAASFDKSVLQISDWLLLEREMLKSQSVSVGDIDGILLAIEKQKNVLRELEFKKPQLEELVHTAESLKTDANRLQLQSKVTRLREHWDETSQCVLQRKSQLAAMLGDSQRYEAKRLEIEAWMQRMENRADRMGTVATTADVLDAQQKEQKSFHAELHQYKHQIELFNQLTQKLIAVYPSDDTSRIKRMTESVNLRYNNLNNAVINRGKLLHAAVHNLQSFDRTMDQFLAWLSEAESLSENAEQEIDRNPHVLKVSVYGNE